MTKPYIDDQHRSEIGDASKAMATHLRELARRLENAAERYIGGVPNIYQKEDIALNEQVRAYIKQNYKQIGDISMAWGLIELVRKGSQIYRKGQV